MIDDILDTSVYVVDLDVYMFAILILYLHWMPLIPLIPLIPHVHNKPHNTYQLILLFKQLNLIL